jgi:glycosyltransferase involved in cell wall biosynthesis
MKVVHVYKDYYPPVLGGIETTLSRMARGTAAAGVDVTVLCSAHGGRRTTNEFADGVRVIRCAEWARISSTPLCPSMPFRLAGLDADLYHLHFPYPPGELSWLLTHPRRPLVVTYHSDIIRQAAVLPLVAPIIHAVLSRARFIMPTSAQYIERSAILRRHRARCRVLPHGIDLGRFAATERLDATAERLRAGYGGPFVLFVGRFRYYKGLRVLLRAMVDVRAHLVLVGGGGEEAELRALCGSLGLGDRVHFVGSIDDEGLLAHYRAADVCVLPSIHSAEAFGLSLIEAMASGTAVVCTELGTGTSFVNRHGETGLVVPPGDPAALAQAIQRLLDDPAERQRMGEAGRRRARELFSSETMVAGLLAVYAEAVR